MAQEIWVITDDATDLYLIGYGENLLWGNIENAITFETEEDAQAICDRINTGGVHPTLAPSH